MYEGFDLSATSHETYGSMNWVLKDPALLTRRREALTPGKAKKSHGKQINSVCRVPWVTISVKLIASHDWSQNEPAEPLFTYIHNLCPVISNCSELLMRAVVNRLRFVNTLKSSWNLRKSY